MKLETTIGLEIHVELNTKSKMFCGCSTDFGGNPNERTCPVCLGFPGVLPVPNREAISSAIMLALALNCKITPRSLFHRKNYFYPDMPKNYQISQYDIPLSTDGWLEIDMGEYRRKVGIIRVHLEEDTGKSIHVGESGRIYGSEYSFEDFNRAGIPLVEIVTRPDIRSPEEARVFLQSLRDMIVWLGISDCKMEEGSLRCDANISLSQDGSSGTKVEIKNMNSFRSLKRALDYEVERQRKTIEEGEEILQETRHYDEAKGQTYPLRSKEEAFDYRYFPEPDLVPIEPDEAWVEEIKSRIPELPSARRDRYCSQFGLPYDLCSVLTREREIGDFFERAVEHGGDPVEIAKWISGDITSLLKEKDTKIENCPVSPEGLSELVQLIQSGEISGKMAKEILIEAFASGRQPSEIVRKKCLSQLSDEDELKRIAYEVIEANPQAVSDFRSGKEQAIKFLMGQVMKKTKGKANPEVASKLLREIISER